MSKVQVDKVVNLSDDGAPQLTYGAELPVGYGLTGAGGLNISGVVTAASAVFSGNVTIGGTLTYEDVTNIDVVGVSTFAGRMNVNSSALFNEGLSVTAGVTTIAGTSTFAKATTVNATLSATEGLHVTAGVTTIAGNVKINNTRTTATNLQIVGGTASGTAYDVAVFAGGQNSTKNSGARIYLSGCENDPLSRGTMIEGLMSDNSNAHDLIFKTSPSSAAPKERLRLLSSGDVGIGTSAPASGADLHLHAESTAVRMQFTNSNTGVSDSDGVRLMIDSSNNFEILNRYLKASNILEDYFF